MTKIICGALVALVAVGFVVVTGAAIGMVTAAFGGFVLGAGLSAILGI